MYALNSKARLIGQSNGGLIAYAWAFRHPECVDKIAGIYPATDFRTWPKLPQVITHPDPGLGYNLTLEELTSRISELNPIDNLVPLAKTGVRILHIHGDQDELVPMHENSTVLAEKYHDLEGEAEIVVIPGLAHGGQVFYESEPLIEFLLAD
jgi:pimeloyl-ACP methyl ester carboxylesterase